MMKPSLLHPLGERGHARRRRSRRPGEEQALRAPTQPPVAVPDVEPVVVDATIRRAHEAGGPIDNASYACCCGYLFSAAVSTTVSCPHCGTDQAW